MANILIVDDEQMILESLRDTLEDEDYSVFTAESAFQAKEILQKEKIELILLDIWLNDADGISLLREWRKEIHCPIIMMSGHGTIETAIEATKLGAYDFLEKPLSTAKVIITIQRALENQALKNQITPPINIIGQSESIQELKKSALHFSENIHPILITGDSGTGKSHWARFIHQQRLTAGKFIRFNLSVQPDEIFNPISALSSADTVYLDEISELSESQQLALLDALEDKKIKALLIASSRLNKILLQNKLLPQLLDLLTVAHLHLPNLNQRKEDLNDWLNYFIADFSESEKINRRIFSEEALLILNQHYWTHHLRELKNLIHRLLFSPMDEDYSEIISAHELESAFFKQNETELHAVWAELIPTHLSFRDAREKFEQQYLLLQFNRCHGNITQLSELIGMDRTNLYRKLRSVNIDPTAKK